MEKLFNNEMQIFIIFQQIELKEYNNIILINKQIYQLLTNSVFEIPYYFTQFIYFSKYFDNKQVQLSKTDLVLELIYSIEKQGYMIENNIKSKFIDYKTGLGQSISSHSDEEIIKVSDLHEFSMQTTKNIQLYFEMVLITSRSNQRHIQSEKYFKQFKDNTIIYDSNNKILNVKKIDHFKFKECYQIGKYDNNKKEFCGNVLISQFDKTDGPMINFMIYDDDNNISYAHRQLFQGMKRQYTIEDAQSIFKLFIDSQDNNLEIKYQGKAHYSDEYPLCFQDQIQTERRNRQGEIELNAQEYCTKQIRQKYQIYDNWEIIDWNKGIQTHKDKQISQTQYIELIDPIDKEIINVQVGEELIFDVNYKFTNKKQHTFVNQNAQLDDIYTQKEQEYQDKQNFLEGELGISFRY